MTFDKPRGLRPHYLALLLLAGAALAVGGKKEAKAAVPEFNTAMGFSAGSNLDISGEHQLRRRYCPEEDAEYFLTYDGADFLFYKSISGGAPVEVTEFSGHDIEDFDIAPGGLEMTISDSTAGIIATYTRPDVYSPWTLSGYPSVGTGSYNETTGEIVYDHYVDIINLIDVYSHP